MKQIIQVYKGSHQWKQRPPGLGDFIRGTCHLYELLDGKNIDLKIDIDQSGLTKFLKPNSNFFVHEPARQVRRAEEYFKSYQHKKLLQKISLFEKGRDNKFFVCTNLGNWQRTSLNDSTRRFMLPLFEFQEEIEEKLHAQIGTNDYEVLSIRCGDRFFIHADSELSMSQYLNLERLFKQEIRPRLTRPLVISSDNMALKKVLAEKFGCIILPYQSKHGAFVSNISRNFKNPLSRFFMKPVEQDLEPLAMDLCMLKNSKFNYHINLYGWWSGFSHYTSIIFNIPTLNMAAPDFSPVLIEPSSS